MPGPYLEESSESTGKRRGGLLVAVILLFVLFICSRLIASTLIDYAWWTEMGHTNTWISLFLYSTLPAVLVTLIFWAAFFLAFRLGIHAEDRPLFGLLRRNWITKLALGLTFILAVVGALLTVDNWTAVRFMAGLQLPPNAHEFTDPVFGRPLHFYFFGLPFWNMLRRVAMTGAIVSLLIYWLSANLENLSSRMPSIGPSGFNFESGDGPSLRAGLNSTFVRIAAAIVLLGFSVQFFFSRYDLLFTVHGPFLTGVDWTAEHVALPLQWLMIIGAILAAILVVARQARIALLLLLILPIRYGVPAAVAGLYVRPSELALERPYIGHYIEATRAAYGLNTRTTETSFEAQPEIAIDYNKHKALLDNVRLWDWHAFHDTISQIQPLRPYVYYDSDVDRYLIDGQLRQVLVSARELDTSQLGTAANWINSHLMYTHGYGIVMAEANRITPDGLPLLFVKNAPPEVTSHSLKLTRPEIYFAETLNEPVFMDTAQQEFNYPSGSETEYTTYKGTGGVPISSFLMRLASAIHYTDGNILLTSYLKAQSRMMLHRKILDRVDTLAGFVDWDGDPYIVLNDAGHLIWMIDGYMTSDAHPYSHGTEFGDRSLNYIRNSVKATVDAYTGHVNLYIFDSSDILIQAYQRLFPGLFQPYSAMPADLRAHARYPEQMFSVQAQIYQAFHMRDPEAFYNRADLWDLVKTGSSQSETGAAIASPTYVVATLPGQQRPEFMLIAQFTPANKDNLIGYMAARCDGTHLGELVFEQLGKQNVIFGPMQIDARINQDQSISKDLTLWNQQGSKVLRGQTLVLPIENSFLYVEPIYIQASQTSMPQLKKVALAMGNLLAYADTYEQALSQLIQEGSGAAPNTTQESEQPAQPSTTTSARPEPGVSPEAERKLREIRDHLSRYRTLSAQGKWAEAGKELEAIQQLLK